MLLPVQHPVCIKVNMCHRRSSAQEQSSLEPHALLGVVIGPNLQAFGQQGWPSRLLLHWQPV